MLFHWSFEKPQYDPPEKIVLPLTRLHKVQRAIIVTSVVHVPVQIPAPFTLPQSFSEVHKDT